MEEDKLKIMFDKQYALQKKLGVYDKLVENNTNIQLYLNQNFLALHEESVEIMRETAYKNPDFVKFGWKKHQVMNLEKAKDELVDLWHFVMNISIAIGMSSDDFYARYCKKNTINVVRHESGY